MTGKVSPTFAVIVPATAEWLTARAREAYQTLSPSDSEDESPRQWEVAVGTGQYSAVRGFDAGDLAWDLAALLSGQAEGKTYLVHLNELTRGSYLYHAGHGLGEIPEDPERLASGLGVPFPTTREEDHAAQERSVVIVEGAAPQAVADAIGLPPGDRAIVRFAPHPLGTMIYTEDGSSVLGIPAMVKGPVFEPAVIYALERSRRGALTIWIWGNGKIDRFFVSDRAAGREPPGANRIWEVMGATDIPGILEALHVPPALVGW